MNDYTLTNPLTGQTIGVFVFLSEARARANQDQMAYYDIRNTNGYLVDSGGILPEPLDDDADWFDPARERFGS